MTWQNIVQYPIHIAWYNIVQYIYDMTDNFNGYIYNIVHTMYSLYITWHNILQCTSLLYTWHSIDAWEIYCMTEVWQDRTLNTNMFVIHLYDTNNIFVFCIHEISLYTVIQFMQEQICSITLHEKSIKTRRNE